MNVPKEVYEVTLTGTYYDTLEEAQLVVEWLKENGFKTKIVNVLV